MDKKRLEKECPCCGRIIYLNSSLLYYCVICEKVYEINYRTGELEEVPCGKGSFY